MPVTDEKRDHIGIVTLSRPTARNAWGPDFNEGLERHCDAMEDDDDIRCAILTGDESGGAFSAGANLKDPKTHTMASTEELIKSIPKRKHRAFEVLDLLTVPTTMPRMRRAAARGIPATEPEAVSELADVSMGTDPFLETFFF